MIFMYSTVAGFISLIAIPLFFLLVYRWNKPVIKSQQDLMAGYALNESNFINTLKGITEIKSMNWESLYVTGINRYSAIFRKEHSPLEDKDKAGDADKSCGHLVPYRVVALHLS